MSDNSRKKLSPVWIMLILALVGVILILLPPLAKARIIPVPDYWSGDFKSIIKSVSQNIGQAFLVGGIIGIVFDVVTVKKYFEERISDILINDEYLKHQEDAELMRLRQRATENIYQKKAKYVDPELIKLDKKICESLTETYFDYLKISTRCNLSDDRKTITKKVRTRFKFINPQREPASFLDITKNRKSRLTKIEGLKNCDIRKILEYDISIDESPMRSIKKFIEVDVQEGTTVNESSNYDIISQLKYQGEDDENDRKSIRKSLLFKDSFEVNILEERIIPSSDLNYSFRVNQLVRDFSINLAFENEDINLIGGLYGTMSNPREGISIDKDSNSINIECKKWMLKGNGVYVNMLPKDWKL